MEHGVLLFLVRIILIVMRLSRGNKSSKLRVADSPGESRRAGRTVYIRVHTDWLIN